MPPFSNPTGACSPSAPVTRRRLLSAGGLGMFGLTMPRFLRGADAQQAAALAAASATTPGLDKLVARAKSVLAKLEAQDRNTTTRALIDDLPLFAVPSRAAPEPHPPSETDQVLEALNALHPDEMSPREALDALYALKAKLPK